MNALVLIVRGHTGVPDHHCRTVLPIILIQQYRFATPKSLQTRPGPVGCTTAPLCNGVRVEIPAVAVPPFPS